MQRVTRQRTTQNQTIQRDLLFFFSPQLFRIAYLLVRVHLSIQSVLFNGERMFRVIFDSMGVIMMMSNGRCANSKNKLSYNPNPNHVAKSASAKRHCSEVL